MEKRTVNDDAAQPWVHRFGELPVIAQSIYAVNPGIPTEFLFSEARCLVDSLAEVAGDGVKEPMTSAAAWLLESNLRRLEALVHCIEANVLRSRVDASREQKEAA
jgi:hypothetical protein